VPTGQNHVRILFKLSQPANVAICVLDSHGVVQRELDHANDPVGWSSIWYFGYNTAGALLPAGIYTVVVAASNSSGTNTAQTKLTIDSGSSA
jgi:flagellar hook assembly protein FlgD